MDGKFSLYFYCIDCSFETIDKEKLNGLLKSLYFI